MEGKKQLQINCSPGTYGKIRNDPELVENYSKHFMETQRHFDEIVFTPIVEPGLAESSAVPNSTDKIIFSPVVASYEPNSCNTDEDIFIPLINSQEECVHETIASCSLWTDSATKLLLDEIKKLWGKVGKSINLKSKSQLWKRIAEKLSKEGYGFSQVQVETKFRGLERQYKKAKLDNSQTGRSRMTCVYQSQLDEVFGVKKGINPDYTIESENPSPSKPSSQVESNEEAESSQETLFDGPSTSANAPKITERGKLLKKLDEISKRKEERHQKLIEILERREESRKEERKEREKRKEEMGKKMLDLLEKVVEKITK